MVQVGAEFGLPEAWQGPRWEAEPKVVLAGAEFAHTTCEGSHLGAAALSDRTVLVVPAELHLGRCRTQNLQWAPRVLISSAVLREFRSV